MKINFQKICPALIVLAVLIVLSGCARYQPKLLEDNTFMKRAETKTDGKVSVTVAVLEPKESKEVFGAALAYRWIQPVWINVENHDDVPYWMFKTGIDPQYFAPLEVASKFHRAFQKSRNRRMDRVFQSLEYRGAAMPGGSNSGFVFTNLNLGAKDIEIDLISVGKAKHFSFFIPLSKTNLDYEGRSAEKLYSETDLIPLDDEGLRKTLAELPCCTTDKKGKAAGDPINLVFIGNKEDLFPALIRRGWRVSEKTYGMSALRTVQSSLFGHQYLFSPVSSLYFFGRSQDIALQKPRGSINERNHMRFWLSPYRYDGKMVWVGQISRDIGVRFTKKLWPPVTHAVDPDFDEARTNIIEDMIYSQGVSRLGFVEGVGASTPEKPVRKMMGDYYYTDGLRAVLEFSPTSTPLSGIKILDWEQPRLWKEKFEKAAAA